MSDYDNTILKVIYINNHKRMLYIARRILGTEKGEEAVHDTFVKLIEKYSGKFEELCDKPGQFFVLIVRNHSIDLVRKEKTSLISINEFNEDIVAFKGESPEETVLSMEAEDIILKHIRDLRPKLRRLLEYRYILGYSNKEIAEEMNVSQSSVSTGIERAKNKLREQLEKEPELL